MLSEYSGPRVLALWHEMRTLPPGANAYRVYYEFARKFGFHKRLYRAEPISDGELLAELGGRFPNADALLAHLRTRRVPFFFDWRGREAYAGILNSRFADDRARCLELADAVCAHRFNLMGCQVEFPGEIDWHRMLEKGESWPRRHWSTINIRCPVAPGEIKTTWELNRLQFWNHLGRAYWYTGDPKYPTEWARQLRSWIDQNPVEIGVNWLSNLEHALRVIGWAWCLNFFLDSPAVTADLVFDMYRMLLAKGRHLRRDIAYSLRVMPTNHLLGDALGLVFLGYVFPEFKEAREWREFGLKVLWDQLPRQVRADGSSTESSISYHRFVLYFYILADLLDRANGGKPPALVRERMEKMTEVVQAVTKPDGTTSLFGDIDNAKTIFLSNEGPQDYRPTLATGAALFGRGDFRHTAGRLSQEVLWLLGPAGIEAFDRTAARPPAATAVSFPLGGIHTWRSTWNHSADYALLKCAPFTGHAEADLNHMDLSLGGRNLLVDAGTYTYNGPWEWRRFFRGTSAHNSVSVDGHSQALTHRSFRFLFHPGHTGTRETRAGDVLVLEGWHRSFQFLGGIRHHRALVVVGGRYWVVVDCLTGRADEHTFGQHWHFDADVDVSVGEGTMVQATPRGGETAWFIPAGREGLRVEVVSGGENPIQGWTTRGFGVKLAAPCATYLWKDRLPTVRAVAIVPERACRDAAPVVRAADVQDSRGRTIGRDEAVGIIVETPGWRDTLVVRLGSVVQAAVVAVEGETFAPGEILKTRTK